MPTNVPLGLKVEPMVAPEEMDTSKVLGVGAPGEDVGVKVTRLVAVGTVERVAAITETVEENVGESTAVPVTIPPMPKEGLGGKERVGERDSPALRVALGERELKGVGVDTRAVPEEVEVAASAKVEVATPEALLEDVGAGTVIEAVDEGVRVLPPPPPLVPVMVMRGVGETREENVGVTKEECVVLAVVVGRGGEPDALPVLIRLPLPVPVNREVKEEVGLPPPVIVAPPLCVPPALSTVNVPSVVREGEPLEVGHLEAVSVPFMGEGESVGVSVPPTGVMEGEEEEEGDTLDHGLAVEFIAPANDKEGGEENVGDTVDVAVSPPTRSVPVCETLTVGVAPIPLEAVGPLPSPRDCVGYSHGEGVIEAVVAAVRVPPLRKRKAVPVMSEEDVGEAPGGKDLDTRVLKEMEVH